MSEYKDKTDAVEKLLELCKGTSVVMVKAGDIKIVFTPDAGDESAGAEPESKDESDEPRAVSAGSPFADGKAPKFNKE